MPDIAHVFDGDTLTGDWLFGAGGAVVDAGLETAVVLSLFTDARALPSDALPDGSTDRRGHWADAVTGRPKGSRLWLLSREVTRQVVARRAEDYAREALAWMIDDGVADRIDVAAGIEGLDRLGLVITLWRDGAEIYAGRFGTIWKAIAA
jgi:phage gp46-like protein